VLAAAGAAVAITGRRVDRLEDLERSIVRAGGSALASEMDVTRISSIREALERIDSSLGTIDVLINNSGVSVAKPLECHEEADYDGIMDTNAKGAFFVAREVARRLIQAGRPGRIVNIASIAGLRAIGQLGVYGMSKAAVIAMTRAMAHEWARHGIAVNAICPGYIETEMNREHWNSDNGRKLVERLPRRRLGQPRDLDGLLMLLASDSSGLLNGAIITADDGFSAG
jgi:NAD(P)-dependent dehydrogenase (short-subunit alcohol dehydrogenase family)